VKFKKPLYYRKAFGFKTKQKLFKNLEYKNLPVFDGQYVQDLEKFTEAFSSSITSNFSFM